MRTTSNMTANKVEFQKFKAVRRPEFEAANQFLHKVEQMAVRYGLHVHFRKTDRTDKLRRYYTARGTIGMIEAKDNNEVDMVAPFIGALIDQCVVLNSSPVKACFTRYVEIQDITF